MLACRCCLQERYNDGKEEGHSLVKMFGRLKSLKREDKTIGRLFEVRRIQNT